MPFLKLSDRNGLPLFTCLSLLKRTSKVGRRGSSVISVCALQLEGVSDTRFTIAPMQQNLSGAGRLLHYLGDARMA